MIRTSLIFMNEQVLSQWKDALLMERLLSLAEALLVRRQKTGLICEIVDLHLRRCYPSMLLSYAERHITCTFVWAPAATA